jgi:hypothetical protein
MSVPTDLAVAVPHVDVAAPSPRGWIPGLPNPRGLGAAALSLATSTSRAVAGWRWPVAAALAGVGPFAVSWLTGLPGHQWVSAILLALLLLTCVLTDAWWRGLATLAIAFALHSAVVFAASRADPARAAHLLPGADDYWQKQVTWIRTGQDPEYALGNWVPAHGLLLAGTALYSYTSFGSLTLAQGFCEVDMMNYYTAQLTRSAEHPVLAVLIGWHVWSVLRGLAYLVITFEIVSISFGRLTGGTPVPARVRATRLGIGLAFILADGVTKYLLLEPVRAQLGAMLPGNP